MKGLRKYLVLGHPRSGTGYAAGLFRQIGYDVGHERMGRDGTSSWMFAVRSGPYPFTFDHSTRSRFKFETVIHIVRNPADTISSVFHTEQASEPFRSQYVTLYGDALTRAVQSYIGWNKLISAGRVDVRRKTETLHQYLAVIADTDKAVNARPHPHMTLDEICAGINPALAFELTKFARQYNELP